MQDSKQSNHWCQLLANLGREFHIVSQQNFGKCVHIKSITHYIRSYASLKSHTGVSEQLLTSSDFSIFSVESNVP